MPSPVYDVVCIGGGAAGAVAAVTASAAGARVALVSKEPVGGGNTKISRGAMCVPGLVAGDSAEVMAQDIVRCGEGMSNPKIVAQVTSTAAEAAALLESMGLVFDREGDGELSRAVLKQTGGHSFPRTVEVATRGAAWNQALRTGIAASAVDVFEDTIAGKLVVHDKRVCGVLALDLQRGEVLRLAAKAVILATGGAGFLFYPHADNATTVTGDGYALAFEAGAELVDMEFIQILTIEGGWFKSRVRLLNRDGEEVLPNLGRQTRAQITAAFAREMARGKLSDDGALLFDPADGKSPLVPVWPRVHTFLGGVRVNEKGRSTVPGLYAAGETAGGLQGADRLGSSALTQALATGITAGKWAAEERHRPAPSPLEGSDGLDISTNGTVRQTKLIHELQAAAWGNLGLLRSSASCQKALDIVGRIQAQIPDISATPTRGYNAGVAEALELKFMATTARLVAHAALARAETRGSHLRTDFPDRDEALGRCNFVLSRQGDDVKVRAEPVGSTTWD